MNTPLWNRKILDAAEMFLCLAAILGALATLANALLRVGVPFEMDTVEGYLLASGARIARGLSAYPPPAIPPYVLQSYGPIPLYLVALCVKLCGSSFTLPRLLVVATGVWCAVLVGLLVHHWSGSPRVAVSFGALYLTRPIVKDWLPHLRVDLIGLGFALTGLAVFTRSRRWYLSLPFFVAAVFCKTTLVAAPVACLLYALVRGEGRRALGFATGCAALGAAAFLVAQHATQGWFAFHTFWLNAGHPYSLRLARPYLVDQFRHDYGLLAMGLVTVYYARARPALWLTLIYLGLSGLGALGVGKLGANFNYFLEWEAALCLGVGLAYHNLCAPGQIWNGFSVVLPAGLAMFLLAGVHPKHLRPNLASNYSGCTQAYGYIKSYRGKRVLSENLGAQVLAGEPPVVFDPFLWTHEVAQGRLSDAEVIKLIDSQQIDLIVLAYPADPSKMDIWSRWPPSVLSAVQQNYLVAEEFNCKDTRYMYVPKGQ